MHRMATGLQPAAEEVLVPDGYELVDGELVEQNMGWNSACIGGELYHLLRVFCSATRPGWVAPADASYQCFPDSPGKVRKPDVSFVRRGRLPGEQPPEGNVRIAPDMAAEVVSPNDSYYEVEAKVQEYLAAGVRLVWVVNPATRMVRVHGADGTVADIRADGELSGEDVIVGFRCRVADLFRPQTDPPEPSS